MTDSTDELRAVAAPISRQERNKRTVVAFYQAAIIDKDFARARMLLGDTYTQHNPQIADGLDGLEAFLGRLAKAFPGLTMEIKRLIAEGDYVAAQVHGVRVPGQPGSAIVDIFRFEGDKIIEHWDVMQPIPVEAANTNTMF